MDTQAIASPTVCRSKLLDAETLGSADRTCYSLQTLRVPRPLLNILLHFQSMHRAQIYCCFFPNLGGLDICKLAFNGSTLIFCLVFRVFTFMLKFMAASFKTLDWIALQLPATPVCIEIQRTAMEFVDTHI